MKNIVLNLFICTVLFACNNSSSTVDSGAEEFNEAKMNSFYKELNAKELKPDQIIKYKSFATAGLTGDKLDQLATANEGTCSAFPTSLSSINSESGFDYYKYTSDKQADAKFMGFGGTIGKNELVIVRDYVRFQLVPCGSDTKKIGIGLRCFVHVKKLKGSISASLANIAGSVQLNRGEASFSIHSLGFAIGGDLIAEGLVGQSDFNVDNFAKVETTYANVIKLLKDDSPIRISPVELPR
jgi:hypothetical protein